MFQLPPNAKRVALSTSEVINRRIADKTAKRIAGLAAADEHTLRMHIAALDREWDTERVLETNAAVLILAGMSLGALKDKRWFCLSGAVAAFLLQHALQGWCPPLPMIRKLGVRTTQEIEAEKARVRTILVQRVADQI